MPIKIIRKNLKEILQEENNTKMQIGENLFVTFRRKKPFTKKQIENIEKYFGIKVINL